MIQNMAAAIELHDFHIHHRCRFLWHILTISPIKQRFQGFIFRKNGPGGKEFVGTEQKVRSLGQKVEMHRRMQCQFLLQIGKGNSNLFNAFLPVEHLLRSKSVHLACLFWHPSPSSTPAFSNLRLSRRSSNFFFPKAKFTL